MMMTASASAVALISLALMIVAVAVASAVVTSTATTFATETSQHALNLIVGGFTFLYYLTSETESLACQRMIEVELHLFVGDGEHLAVESVAFLVLQGDDSIHEDILVVEMAIDAERLAIELYDAEVLVVAVSLFLSECEIKLFSCLKGENLVFEGINSHAKTTYPLEGFSLGSLLYQCLFTVLIGIELVAHCHIKILLFHIERMIYLFYVYIN